MTKKLLQNNILTNTAQINITLMGGLCMKGSIGFRQTGKGGYYFVRWPEGGKEYKISRYKGFLCRSHDMAQALLSCMRSDYENGVFRLTKYTRNETNVIPFLLAWVESETHLSPATKKDYLNSIHNHLKPYFQTKNIMLHEIQYDVLCNLLANIKRDGKGKRNVMYCLHAALISALKAGKIEAMPVFPEKRKYGIQKKKRKGLPTDRQVSIIQAIPEEHRPIFWWLKYHYRRPSEACALHTIDYDPKRDCFTIRRTFSNKVLVNYTKTHHEHEIPCNPLFRPIMKTMPKNFSKFFFLNPSPWCKTKKHGSHYTVTGLEHIWNTACKKVGETISLYQGTKHSACWQYLNEQGGTLDELQTITDHKRRESVSVYGEMELETKRKLMGKVMPIPEHLRNMAK
jgi:integrase